MRCQLRCQLWMAALSVTLFLLTGCGKSENAGPAADGSGISNRESGPADSGSADAAAFQSAKPTEIVARFYDALRDGDASKIAALLTDKAREETSRSGLAIRSPGSASLAYQIGEFEYVTPEKDGAHVKSVWTEVDADGQRVSTDVIWVMRKQQNGWRVAGMATPVEEGQLPLLFNFEDPENMLKNKELVERQRNADQETAVQQAAKPAVETEHSTVMR